MKTLLRGIQLNGKPTNILINGNRFESVNAPDNAYANTAIECHRYAILPAFYNAHNHAAMTILRGYADDMPLQTWLEDHIWPKERAMGRAEVYEGSVMAINEMISSGTVFFNDMYFSMSRTATAVREAGIRAAIGVTYMDSYSDKMKASKEERICNWMEDQDSMIQITAAPHAVYTVSGENLQKLYRLARDHGRRFHIHISETRKEVEDCMKAFGMTPVRYLDKLGVLGPDVIAAHCVHVDREEWDILAERGVTVVHCPCSNMKLGSGFGMERRHGFAFPWHGSRGGHLSCGKLYDGQSRHRPRGGALQVYLRHRCPGLQIPLRLCRVCRQALCRVVQRGQPPDSRR